MHEHLLLDARLSWQEPTEASLIELAYQPVTPDILHNLRQNPFINLDNCFLFDEEAATWEVSRFRQFGGGTVVDATCRGIGRDPAALQRISRRTGLHIVMGTGYYLERTHPPEVVQGNIGDLQKVMVRDLTEGDEATGVKAGYIGEIGIGQAMTKREEKVLRAAARAQHDTGVALSIHLPGWERLGHRVLDVIAEEGGNLESTILDHMNPSWRDFDYQVSLADRGAYLEYDMIGMDYYFADQDAQCPSDEENASAIKKLVDAGYTEKLLLSHDVFLKMMLVRYGGNGYAYINEHFLPRLRRHGVSNDAITTMLMHNPARALRGTA
jgi:phosphotriesterase-related protein